jgi:hypothetical protein
VTGTSVLALKYKDGVLMACDTLGSYGSTKRYKSVERMKVRPAPFEREIPSAGAPGPLSFPHKSVWDVTETCQVDHSLVGLPPPTQHQHLSPW